MGDRSPEKAALYHWEVRLLESVEADANKRVSSKVRIGLRAENCLQTRASLLELTEFRVHPGKKYKKCCGRATGEPEHGGRWQSG